MDTATSVSHHQLHAEEVECVGGLHTILRQELFPPNPKHLISTSSSQPKQKPKTPQALTKGGIKNGQLTNAQAANILIYNVDLKILGSATGVIPERGAAGRAWTPGRRTRAAGYGWGFGF